MQVLRNEQVSCAADLWALGCVLYQMLEGRPPFKSGSEYLTFQRILEGGVEVPSHVPAHAADLIRRLLASDPAQRIGWWGWGEGWKWVERERAEERAEGRVGMCGSSLAAGLELEGCKALAVCCSVLMPAACTCFQLLPFLVAALLCVRI